MLLVFFDLIVFAARPDLFILDIPLPDFDLIEEGPFFSVGFFVNFEDFIEDFTDFDVCDFLPLVLLLNTVPLSY